MSNGYDTIPGKRERFMNLFKSSSNISQTLRQSTSAVWDPTKNSPPYHYREFPSDMDVTYLPTYSTKRFDIYETRIRFIMNYPGNITSRKNRIFVSLSRQYLKSSSSSSNNINNNNSQIASDTPDRISNVDESSFDTESDSFRDNMTDSQELDVLKDRLKGFITKSVGNVPVMITLSNKHEEITERITTDSKGNVDITLPTSFLPESIQLSLDHDQNYDFTMDIKKKFDNSYTNPKGIAIISDIDDTIKHTGITGNKRSMFRNVFVHDMESWLIQYLPEWYNNLKRVYDADFFYVSNSPLQLYDILNDYIRKYLPSGPLFLKQYAGNILSGIFTSSANRKLDSITKIINDFPQKRFILIGDSGEQDLEAYTNVALNYPDQIVAIYIRCCKNSMSDMGLNEYQVMDELNNLIHDRYIKPFEGDIKVPPKVPHKQVSLNTNQPNFLESAKNMYKQHSEPSTPISSPSASPPPRDIHNLHSYNTSPILTRRRVPPPVLQFSIPKPYTEGDLTSLFNKTSNNQRFDDDDKSQYMIPSSQDDYNTYNGYFDKKADSWNRRVKLTIRQLSNIEKYDIGLMFFEDPREAQRDSIERIHDLKE